MLHYHKLKSDSEDYKLEQVRGLNLPSLFVVLTGLLKVQSVGNWVSYRGLSPSTFDAQECARVRNRKDTMKFCEIWGSLSRIV